ncbi:bactofilin family protein [Bathymodiolus septemdierum thioautotrophic gill symbiont]|uniref:Cell shape determination protein CcmA n=1 Tax=endosymbiont of Bathymodiolus septemdierum str. Myojin knoll TaxID=1303921 RepID=A0A0P0UT92_9GAMM|nr:polymer-forming cytoskeletal protein [Bathymodiolus septemdierum thioautotrophic gill symbiont]BAS68418.1 conserved hypothetical protein [endosymbiont of Bathymodiolus septemdierum str. Myojin knoll]
MFATKKPQTIAPSKVPTSTPTRSIPRTTDNSAQKAPVASASSQGKTTISKDCFIKGEVSGNDDVSVLGKVEGTITLKNNILTIEESGNVKANIFARVVNVTGSMTGNIDASEKITIHQDGNVTGDMVAPKIILKDGSYFTGNVSMTDNKVNPINKETTETGKNKHA